ncbi:MAG: inositol monophosphatase family protein, partial [Patescibacteria group bacterium]
MRERLRITDIGTKAAISTLLPRIRDAGRIAAMLQPVIHTVAGPRQKQETLVGKDALTHADLLLEDRIGSDVFTTFSDASFYGEEHENDRISRFVGQQHPFIITADPINGTMQYRDGLPHYETIITICDREWRMLGAIVYRPAFDDAFIAWQDTVDVGARRITWHGEKTQASVLKLGSPAIFNTLHLDTSHLSYRELIENAGYAYVDIWGGYSAQADWPYSQADVLLGMCRGMRWFAP